MIVPYKKRTIVRRRKTLKNRKVLPRKKIDKQQSKQIALLKKEVSRLKNVKEPEKIEIQKNLVSNNINTPVIQIPLTTDIRFSQRNSVSTLHLQNDQFREGEQITIGNINCLLTFYDMNNAFRWRVIVVQYPERVVNTRTSLSTVYNAEDELSSLLKYYHPTDIAMTREEANDNMCSPLQLQKLRENKAFVLHDKVYTGAYREIKIDGVDNQTKCFKFTIKPRMRKLTFANKEDTSPQRGDIVLYCMNDYGYYGTWSSHHQNVQRYKSMSARFYYNVYDE